jgi:hypothetical protein
MGDGRSLLSAPAALAFTRLQKRGGRPQSRRSELLLSAWCLQRSGFPASDPHCPARGDLRVSRKSGRETCLCVRACMPLACSGMAAFVPIPAARPTLARRVLSCLQHSDMWLVCVTLRAPHRRLRSCSLSHRSREAGSWRWSWRYSPQARERIPLLEVHRTAVSRSIAGAGPARRCVANRTQSRQE